VFSAELGSGIAANPFLAFHMRVPGPGELEVTWIDDGGVTVVEKARIEVQPATSQ
jgi:sulfur-oxidizing protein SoxZ